MPDAVQEYWQLAHEAIKAGLLTLEEAKVIACVGTRKQPYWARHLMNLKEIITERKKHDAKNMEG